MLAQGLSVTLAAGGLAAHFGNGGGQQALYRRTALVAMIVSQEHPMCVLSNTFANPLIPQALFAHTTCLTRCHGPLLQHWKICYCSGKESAFFLIEIVGDPETEVGHSSM